MSTKINTVTAQDIEELLNKAEWDMKTIFGKCTVVTCKLPNGFILVESSACVDPANYDHQIGEHTCRERIKNKLWELEGYHLQCMLAAAKNTEKREVCAREVMEEMIDEILHSETRLVFNELLSFIKSNKNFTRGELIGFLGERGDYLRRNPDQLPAYFKYASADKVAKEAEAAAKEAIRKIKKEPVPVPVPTTHLDGAGVPLKQLMICRHTSADGKERDVLTLSLLDNKTVRVVSMDIFKSTKARQISVPFLGVVEMNFCETVPSRHLRFHCDFHPDHLAPYSDKKE